MTGRGTEPPDRAREAPNFGRLVLRGLVPLLLAALLLHGLLLVDAGEIVFLSALVLLGMGMIVVGAQLAGNAVLGIAGAAVMVAPVLVIGLAIDVPLVGPIVETAAAEAPSRRWAAGFRFTDATLRPELARRITLEEQGQRGAVIGYRRFIVAPVMGPGATPWPGAPAWAVAQAQTPIGGPFPPTPTAWAAPGGLLRLLSWDARRAVEALVRNPHATLVRGDGSVASPRIVGLWVPDPGAARDEARWRAALTIGAAALAWCALSALAVAGRQRRTPRGATRR